MNSQIIRNQIQTPDGTVLTSYHVHDYKTYVDTISGEEYMVDGGTFYLRRNLNVVPYIEQSVCVDEPFEIVREAFAWGSRGKKGDEPLHYIPMSKMSNNHIEAVLETQKQIPDWLRELFNKELVYRKENPNTNILE